MFVGFIAVAGSWYFAGRVRNGWWMLLIVPGLALITAFAAGTVRSISGDTDTEAAIAAQLTFAFSLVLGGIVAGIERYRTRTKRLTTAEAEQPSKK